MLHLICDWFRHLLCLSRKGRVLIQVDWFRQEGIGVAAVGRLGVQLILVFGTFSVALGGCRADKEKGGDGPARKIVSASAKLTIGGEWSVAKKPRRHISEPNTSLRFYALRGVGNTHGPETES